MRTTSATELRKSMKQSLDAVSKEKETIIIHRPNDEDVVMIPMSEWNSWQETNYLTSTKANREHLAKSIEQADKGDAKEIEIDNLW